MLKKISKINAKKTWITFGALLVASSAIFSTVSALKNDNFKLNIANNTANDSNAFNENYLTNLAEIPKVYNADLSESQKISSINSIITSDHIESYKTQIVDQLAAKIAYLGDLNRWSNEKIQSSVQQQVGVFLANYDSFIAEQQKDNLNKFNTDEINNANIQKWLNDESKKIGVDVFDKVEAYSNIYQYKSGYLSSLLNSSVPRDQAYKMSEDLFIDLNDNFLHNSEELMFSQTEFDWMFLEYTSSESFFRTYFQNKATNDSLSTFKQSTVDSQLKLILNNYIEYFNNKISINGNSFVDLLKDYSPTGIYDVNSEINLIDLPKLFSFSYNLTQGAILSKPDFTYSSPTEVGEYDSDLLGAVTLPIQKLNTATASYEFGELYPGYLVHFRIIDIEDEIDDDYCNLKLEIGVSDSIRDPQANNVLWTRDFVEDATNVQSLNEEKGIAKVKLIISNIENKRYIAINKFYGKEKWINNFDSNDYNKKMDSWFSSTANDRPYLDTILDNHCQINENGEYILDEKNPIYLFGDEIKGIPIPQELRSFDFGNVDTYNFDGSYKLHTNQTLCFKVTDFSTAVKEEDKTRPHSLSLLGCWSVITNSNKINFSDSKDKSVYDIKWYSKFTSTEYEKIWVKYNINQELLDTLDFFETLCEFYSLYDEFEPFLLDLQKDSKLTNGTFLDDAFKYKNEMLAQDILMGVILALTIVALALSCWMLAFNWKKVVTIALYTVAIIALIVSIALISVWLDPYSFNILTAKNTLKVANENTKPFNDTKNIVFKEEKIIDNPHASFALKKQACVALEEEIIKNPENANGLTNWLSDLNAAFFSLTSEEKDAIKNKLIFSIKDKGFGYAKTFWHGMTYGLGISSVCMTSTFSFLSIAELSVPYTNFLARAGQAVANDGGLMSSVTAEGSEVAISVPDEQNIIGRFSSSADNISGENPLFSSDATPSPENSSSFEDYNLASETSIVEDEAAGRLDSSDVTNSLGAPAGLVILMVCSTAMGILLGLISFFMNLAINLHW